MTGLLFTLIWFPLVGLAVSRLVGRVNWFLAGAGANGFVLFVASVLHVPLIPTIVAIGIASIVVLLRRRADVSSAAGGRDARRPERAADIVMGISIVCLFAITAIRPLADFDGRAFWLLKAKAIAHERQVDGPFFQGKTAVSPRNEYPLLVPLDAATIMIAARDLDERHVRWLYVMFAVALALEVRRRVGPWYGALLLWLPQIAVNPEGSALTAYCDIALAAFIACAVFELAGDSPDPLRLGMWVSFALLTKNEGLPFAIVLLLIGVVVLRARVVIALAPAALAVASLFLWRSRLQPTDEAIFSIGDLPNRLARVDDALRDMSRHMFAIGDWGVLWIAVVAAMVFLAWRKNWRPLMIGAASIVPMLALYVIMYVVSNWNIADLVNSSAPRLLTHFVGPALLLIGSTHASRTND